MSGRSGAREHRAGLAQRRSTRCAAALALALSACIFAVGAPSAPAATPPTASTSPATNISYSGAILHGVVNPHGESTNYLFEYGTTHKYGAQTLISPAGSRSGPVAVSQALGGLLPFTTYHYRIIAINPAGPVVGSDKSFTTAAIPLTVAITGVPNPVLDGSLFTVEGTLSGTGAANHQVVLQTNPFPYTAGFKDVGDPQITNTLGGFSFAFAALTENTEIRVVTLDTPSISSPVLLESVSVHVSLHVRSTRRRGFARLFGSVTPAQVGATVGFQLLRAGHRSVNVGGTIVGAGSTFSRVVHVVPGLYEALVQVKDGAHVASYSAPALIG